jgi:hypothetical protein
MPNFKKAYFEKHQAAVQKELGLGNVMQVPRITKITVNMGLGGASQNSKLLESGIEQLPGNHLQLLDSRFDQFGVLQCLAQPHIDGNLCNSGNLHHIPEPQLLLDGRLMLFKIGFFKIWHVTPYPTHRRFLHKRGLVFHLPTFSSWFAHLYPLCR